MDPASAALIYAVYTTAAGIADAESDYEKRRLADEVTHMMVQAKAAARERRDAADERGDAVERAAADALLAELGALERRTNVYREADKVRAASERFRDSGKRDFVRDKIVGETLGVFGRISQVATDFAGWLYEAAKGPPKREQTPAQMRELYERIVRERDDYVALPDKLGGYLARETYRRVLRDNGQLEGVDPATVFSFACDQAKAELDRELRSALGQQEAEVIIAAQQSLCTARSASGSLDLGGQIHFLQRWLPQRQLRMSYTQGGDVVGTVDIEVAISSQDMMPIIEAASAAAASAVPLSSQDKKELEKHSCSARGTIKLRLEGTHDGESKMSGTATALPRESTLRVVCKGKSEAVNWGALSKGRQVFTAVDRGEDVKVDIEVGMLVLSGHISNR